MVYEEKEITLVAYNESAETISNQISRLNNISKYLLAEAKVQDIVDVSFDTSDKNLFQNHMSLRIRKINGRCLFTLKSNPVFDMSGTVKRDELELEWKPDSFDDLVDALIASGIKFPCNYAFDFDWYKSMNSLGMNVLQERHTKRLAKEIFCEQILIAELAIDEVKYRYEQGDVFHREIEIESKSIFGDSAISIISKHLVQKYPNALWTWMPSKLELGIALQDLIMSGNREILENKKISQELYHQLNDHWKRKSD
tara:strand:+ start:89 stop:853 length:765 start_codon:yes stop_codon:yes gene_type:complete